MLPWLDAACNSCSAVCTSDVQQWIGALNISGPSIVVVRWKAGMLTVDEVVVCTNYGWLEVRSYNIHGDVWHQLMSPWMFAGL
jgi:hypothetical protein